MPPRLARTARSSSRSSKRSDPPPDGDTVAVGEIVAAHALRGVVRVRPYQPPAPSLAAGRIVLLEHDGLRRPVRIDAATPHGRDALLVELAGVGDRTAAERLRGARLLVA